MIGCSPLLRCIETANYLRYDNNVPIYIFPYLREINESNLNISSINNYSADNGLSKNINTNPGLSMKPIDEQKTYLDENDITNVNFDYVKNDNFNYVEDDDNKIRYEPGNIQNFISWFIENVIKKHKNVKKLIY